MSIEGMFLKYGDKYILDHQDGSKYVRWGKIEKDLNALQDLEQENKLLREALDWATKPETLQDVSMSYLKTRERYDEIRKQFKLDGEG